MKKEPNYDMIQVMILSLKRNIRRKNKYIKMIVSKQGSKY